MILPKLQQGHRRELRREPHWSKEELVRHPEPRELIRSMRKPGNLDIEGRPVYTLDERRLLTADTVALTPFLDEVRVVANPRYRPTATLTKDPLYRAVLAVRR
ncbi:MAG: hypothetical protein E6G37_11210 [Actinobacteria bacterium]|nr:MAG: hypothetical protein E6G37_11210 [Actinomycetota bacterium]